MDVHLQVGTINIAPPHLKMETDLISEKWFLNPDDKQCPKH
jgi:hypothetical protein